MRPETVNGNPKLTPDQALLSSFENTVGHLGRSAAIVEELPLFEMANIMNVVMQHVVKPIRRKQPQKLGARLAASRQGRRAAFEKPNSILKLIQRVTLTPMQH